VGLCRRRDSGLLLLGAELVVERAVLGDLVLERGLLRGDLVVGLLGRAGGLLGRGPGLRGTDVGRGGRVEQLVLVARHHLQHAHAVDELVGRVAGHHRGEGAEPLAGERAARDAAHGLLRLGQRGLRLLQLLGCLLRRGLLGLELLPRLVELLGDGLQLVPLGRDQGRGLGGGLRLLRRRRQRGQQRAQDGDEDQGGPPEGSAGLRKGGRHGAVALRFVRGEVRPVDATLRSRPARRSPAGYHPVR
jgi:hypothetical protein